jgi:hypothetical protein
LSPLPAGAIFITFALIKNALVMIHYIERGVEPRHALEIDAAVKQASAVEAAAEDWPIEPVLAVV